MKLELASLRAELESRLEWAEQYETTHCDAGSNYLDSCLADASIPDSSIMRVMAEAGACQQDHDNMRTRYNRKELAKHVFALIPRRDIVQACEARPGHRLDNGCFPDGVSVGEWPVGEFEVDLSDLAETAADRARLQKLGESEFCLRVTDRSAYGYVNTEAVWFAVLPDQACKELVAQAICKFCRKDS